MRNLNGVGDGKVTQTGHFFSNSNGIAFLLDGRIRESLIQALLRISEAHPRNSNLPMHVHFAVPAPRDVHVAGGVRELQSKGAGHGVIAVKAAAGSWTDVA